MLGEIKETYFDKGLRELLKEKYVAVGILLGKFKYYARTTLYQCMPSKLLIVNYAASNSSFMDEDIKLKIFSQEPSEPCISELQKGLKLVGIYQVSDNTFVLIIINVNFKFPKFGNL